MAHGVQCFSAALNLDFPGLEKVKVGLTSLEEVNSVTIE